ncbi:G protein-coupled glucose receptor regulating Gpa2 domain containing protein [Naviculisporaceae sp. PSN 640]
MVLLSALLEGALASHQHVTTRDAPEDYPADNLVDLLTVLSLIFASISVISTLTTLYWFTKMRRSFRHELIMLLIQSDFIKSAAFVVFPLVNLIRGKVESNSAFCQVSGFALALGIESADIAVLLIAVHSVMYIFRPRSGLYPYRRTAYMIYYLFPLTIGCLAFADGAGYQNVGHYCYLRTDHGWARMALSWVPRYIIGASIVCIYAFVYFYVRKRMGEYGRRSSTSMPYPPSRGYRDSEVPPTPPIAYHGLLSSAPNSRRGSAADSILHGQKRSSLSSVSTIRLEQPHNFGIYGTIRGEPGGNSAPRSTRPFQWNSNWSGFDKQPATTSSAFLLHEDQADPLSSPPPVHSPEASHHPTRKGSASSATNVLENKVSRQSTENSTMTAPSTTTASSSTFTAKDDVQPTIALPTPPLLPPPAETSPNLMPTETFGGDDYAGVTKNREKIRRQLRSLIVYPLAYMITWVFPFVSHVMGYDGKRILSEPVWLMAVSLVSLCIQGTVDSLLITIREQPWRHARGRFWSAVGKRLASSVNFWTRGAAGRTKEEMLVDGRLARERREEEIVFERARAGRVAGSGGMGGGYFSGGGMRRWNRLSGRGSVGGVSISMVGAPNKVRREWWDVDFADGGLSDDGEDVELAAGQRRASTNDIESGVGVVYGDIDQALFSSSETTPKLRQDDGESPRTG